jgi:hypothetical protein
METCGRADVRVWKILRGLSPRANYTERASDRRLSTNLMPTFAYRGVSRSQRDGSPTAIFWAFYTGTATFSSKQLLNCTERG